MESPVINHYHIPQPPLSEFVALFWLYEAYTPPHPSERLLPTGTVELVVDLRREAVVLAGPHSRYFVLDTSEPLSALGVHFRPGGAFPFLGLPAGELHNTTVSLEALWRAGAGELRERALEAGTPAAKVRVIEEALIARATRPLARHPAVDFALREFYDVEQPRTVAQVTGQLGMSARRFIQVFSDEVGLTPKLYCRVRRFQEALARIQGRQRIDWTDVALGCGYYDQAHFIHDFRAFSGLCPTAYLARRTESPNHVPHEE